MADPLQLSGQVLDRLRGQNGVQFCQDLDVFLKKPDLWRTPVVIVPAAHTAPSPAKPITDLRAWMQGVYDDPKLELPVKVEVPKAPVLTKQQRKAFWKFGIRALFVPALAEDKRPPSFVQPAWGKYLTASAIERKPLAGQWVAVETIAKSNWDDPNGYPNDRLAKAVGLESRFRISWDDLHTGGLLARIAEKAHLPKAGTRLPTVEEWNFIANLLNWLRKNRQEDLPDLGSTNSWEWVESAYGSGYRCFVGSRGSGGLSAVDRGWRGNRYDDVAFRVLAVL